MGASSYRLLAAANRITSEQFFTVPMRGRKKTADAWRVYDGLRAFAHEPAQTQTPEKPKQKAKTYAY